MKMQSSLFVDCFSLLQSSLNIKNGFRKLTHWFFKSNEMYRENSLIAPVNYGTLYSGSWSGSFACYFIISTTGGGNKDILLLVI